MMSCGTSFGSLLPERAPQKTGRPRVDDRVVFNAVVYVLVTGIAWRYLPAEMGCSPATAHRRRQEWQRHGVWRRLHQELLRQLNAAGRVDWRSGVIDGSHAVRGSSDVSVGGVNG